jgi:hypothetical protein
MASSTWLLFQDGWSEVSRKSAETIVALRADGSRSWTTAEDEFQLFGVSLPPDPPARRIELKPEGRLVRLNARRLRAELQPLPEPDPPADEACTAAARKAGWSSPAARLTVTGAGLRLGEHVVRWRIEDESRPDRIDMVVELAPRLGCARLFTREVWRRGSAWLPRRIYTSQAISLTLGEPDPALFLVPAEYRLSGEVPPPASSEQAALMRNLLQPNFASSLLAPSKPKLPPGGAGLRRESRAPPLEPLPIFLPPQAPLFRPF